MVHIPGKGSWREILFGLLLVSLLAVLALLQYQWIEQVARAVRDRRKADLEAVDER